MMARPRHRSASQGGDNTPVGPLAGNKASAAPAAIEFHPLAELLPLLVGDVKIAFEADVKDRGQLEPITLYEGKILDGRNRYLACQAAGIEPRFETPEITDPLAFVISKNVQRRMLNESQRALAAARLETLGHGGDRKTRQDANLRVDRKTAAAMFHISERSVCNAADVLKHGDPTFREAVERGEMSVSAAAKRIADAKKEAAERAKAEEERKRQREQNAETAAETGQASGASAPEPGTEPQAGNGEGEDAGADTAANQDSHGGAAAEYDEGSDPLDALDGPGMESMDSLDPRAPVALAEHRLDERIVELIKDALTPLSPQEAKRREKAVLTPAKVRDIVTAIADRVVKFTAENPNYGAADAHPAGGNGKAAAS